MNNARFKIDFRHGYSYSVIGLYHRRQGWFCPIWDLVEAFSSIEDAKAHYEKIKDLPEYLP